ncbi:MAG: carboxymuconolactone decarboxylase family protein [Gillisia sp.]
MKETNPLKRILLVIPFLFFSFTLCAQDTNDYEKAKKEIETEFGTFPAMFASYPKAALAGVWGSFKQLNGPNSTIPPKYRELLQLAVASQIPCNYCIYFHTASAKAFGATDEEIKEAVAQGAQTRHWSMILQGNQINLETFKTEFDGMMTHMANKSKQ